MSLPDRTPLRLLFALSLGFGGLILATRAAEAAQCAPREGLIAALADRYDERPQAMGLAANQSVLEVFASPQGSWTVTVTLPDGTACLLASGQYFQTLGAPPPGDPA
ncbi:hypothetical protein [Gemmobacter serpentinus]|uniref:hypothetical protein n=1 Tax=Gemmobacter serpentinus TaxID=2652247 RepID=UPI001CF70985|nr:hypothetical protein [Gemmobacter serpentinus]